MTTEATILHADADSFFASVEQRDDPGLRDRPVIVGGGVVLAASYEAKAYGIRTAMGGSKARRLCPHAVVVRPRMAAYAEASRALYALFEDTTPSVEGLSIDEAFLDVHGMERLAGTPWEIAARLRRRARESLGLPVTVGIARTKHLAKIASAVAKPDGLLLVPPGTSSHSFTPSRSSGSGESARQPRSGCAASASPPRVSSPACPRPSSRRSSVPPGRATFMPWPTITIPARSAGDLDAARSAPSTRSA